MKDDKQRLTDLESEAATLRKILALQEEIAVLRRQMHPRSPTSRARFTNPLSG